MYNDTKDILTLLVSGRMPEPADAKFMPVVILFLLAFVSPK
jgi:hypothetical protein